ncbi:homeobox protein engrailed-1 [Rana temporaria]|uniref:homeobox protein engrailed-1 n=1 Tax=Rana temporaria TaxID=8407 RepID=UPI001AAD993C|nr:homeobox protein engrailed-1 [Rana temporaria]
MEDQTDRSPGAPSDPESGVSPPPPHRTTNFFIDNILRPDFGCRKETPGRENPSPNPDTDPPTDTPNSTIIIAAAPQHNKSSDPMVWPAWVYCTRYSDRPSSENNS